MATPDEVQVVASQVRAEEEEEEALKRPQVAVNIFSGPDVFVGYTGHIEMLESNGYIVDCAGDHGESTSRMVFTRG
eukprot:jgi/Tetstr1/441878/TSEL_030088.t1